MLYLVAGNVKSLENRDDVGAVFENFFIIERLKHSNNLGRYPNMRSSKNRSCYNLENMQLDLTFLHKRLK